MSAENRGSDNNISQSGYYSQFKKSTLSIQNAHQILILKLKSRLLTQTNQIVQYNKCHDGMKYLQLDS